MILVHPLLQTVNRLSNATFVCEASTDPDEVSNLKIQWYFDGNSIERESFGDRLLVVTELGRRSYLHIGSVRREDEGMYTCSAGNELDSVQSQPAQLRVKGIVLSKFEYDII